MIAHVTDDIYPTILEQRDNNMRFLMAIVIICASACPVIANENLCGGKSANLNCLKENFSELYATNYDLFWDILHNAAQRLKVHQDISDVTAFMELSTVIKGNTEVTEFFSKVCEEFCVSSPGVCLEALIKLDEESKKSCLERLRNPIYLPKMEIDSVFEKYKKIASLYFEYGTKGDGGN